MDAERLDGYAPRSSLLLIARDGLGRLWQSRLSVNFLGLERWTARTRVPGSSRVLGEPALARYGPCSTYLAYKDTQGKLRYRHLSCRNGWEPEQLAQTPDGTPIVISPFASPGIVRGQLPSQPRVSRLIGAFVDLQGKLTLWRLDRSSGRWEPTTDLEGATGVVRGRPAMAWVPWNRPSGMGGRLYMTWTRRETTPPHGRRVRMAMTYTSVRTGPLGKPIRSERAGLTSDFDNQWTYAYGIDLFYEAAFRPRLMSIEARAKADGTPRELSVRPKADGINDFTYTNFNDWATLRVRLCRNVVNPGGLGPNRVRCP
jgi:hypothetical protein